MFKVVFGLKYLVAGSCLSKEADGRTFVANQECQFKEIENKGYCIGKTKKKRIALGQARQPSTSKCQRLYTLQSKKNYKKEK